MTDRRREVRIAGEHRVVLDLPPGEEPGQPGTEFVYLTSDLSAGGIRVLTDMPWPIGSRVSIELALRRPRRMVSGFALVRWVRPHIEKDIFEMGLEFTELAPEGLAAILEYLYHASRSSS